MVSDTQRQLLSWVRSVSDAQVSFARPPADPPAGTGVSLYLLEVCGRLPHSPARPDHQQLLLGYLVTGWAAAPAEAEQLLVDLYFAALEQPAMEVDAEPPEWRLWQALGVAPQPSFRLRVPLRRRRPAAAIRPVLQPLIVEPAALASLAGVVRTPDAIPVPDARVEVPTIGRRATTDRRGHFRLDGVPRDGGPLRIRVRARGREVTREVGEREDRSSVVITLNPLEGVDA